MSPLADWLNLNQLDNLENLDSLQNLENVDRDLDVLQQLQKLDKLDQLDHLEKLDQFHLDRLEGLDRLETLQSLDQLQAINTSLNQLGQLDHRLERLESLQHLQKLDRLDNLSQLSQLHHLEELFTLQELQYMDNLSHLDQLNQLHSLTRLDPLERVTSLNYTTLFIIASVLVPGLIFQEAISLLVPGGISLKRAIVLMAVYNVLNLFLCIQWIFSYLTNDLMNDNPILYYAGWFFILLLLPLLAGVLSAYLTRLAFRRGWFKPREKTARNRGVAGLWGRFLHEAERHQLVITLNNEEKIRAIFKPGTPLPESAEPQDLYITETAHYDPQSTVWQEREKPVDMWVRGNAIKTVEVLPEA